MKLKDVSQILWGRKRILLSVLLYFGGLGCLGGTILISFKGLSGNNGLESVLMMFTFMFIGYASMIISQLLLFSEVWVMGSHLLKNAGLAVLKTEN